VQLFSTLTMFSTTELHLSEADVGLLYTVNGALVLLLQIPAVALIDRAGPRRAIVIGPLLYTIAYLAIGVSGSYLHLALAVALLTAGEVVFAPALSDMAVHLGDPRRLGRAFGLFGLMQQLGVSVGPLVGGLAYDHLRHDHLLMWGAIAGGMAAVGVGYTLFAALWKRRTS
jgi:MFS family permease